jgi:hypothetical protein
MIYVLIIGFFEVDLGVRKGAKGSRDVPSRRFGPVHNTAMRKVRGNRENGSILEVRRR